MPICTGGCKYLPHIVNLRDGLSFAILVVLDLSGGKQQSLRLWRKAPQGTSV